MALHLHEMKLSCQVPCYQARQQDPQKVEDFINHKFPLIQRVAQRMGADIAFEDEAGIGLRTRSGRTWAVLLRWQRRINRLQRNLVKNRAKYEI